MDNVCTAILILNYNSADDTINCIRSIEACNSAAIKFIVVDNGSSTEGETDCLDSFFSQSGRSYHCWNDSDYPQEGLPYYSLIASRSNDGYARGNNKGLRLAYGDSSIQNILILNSDILFTEDILPALLHLQQEKADCGLMTPLIVSQSGVIDHCCARKEPTNWEIIELFAFFRRDLFHILSRANKRQKILLNKPNLSKLPFFTVDFPSGACMFIDKRLFQEIGGFDPGTFLYYEELILHKKLQRISRTNYCVPSVRCTHLGARSTEHSTGRFLQRCNLESADHYLSHYGHLSHIQRLVWGIVKRLWFLKFSITKT